MTRVAGDELSRAAAAGQLPPAQRFQLQLDFIIAIDKLKTAVKTLDDFRAPRKIALTGLLG